MQRKNKDDWGSHKKSFIFVLCLIFELVVCVIFKLVGMGVPGFYSWLTKRYPMIKQMIKQESLPQIDYLYLDMNGIIYKCVRDDSIIFKSQLMPKELEEIWIQIFNYINQIVDMLKPKKMVVMALDGVAPRCKMNNQRSRRFRSAQEYKDFIAKFYGYTDIADSQENFKNNSISPGTRFMQQLNEKLHFFVQKKIHEDDYWKSLSIVFTGSDTPGEGQHKIMEFVRANKEQFLPDDTHCFYGADADLIMLGLTLPVKNACIIRQQYVHSSERVHIMTSRKEKEINFELIYLTILKQCLNLQYKSLQAQMKIPYDIDKIARDFVFLFFFIGNDFLPRIYAYNIRQKSIEKLIDGFKAYLVGAESYITEGDDLNLTELLRLLSEVGKYEAHFFADKQLEFEKLLTREQKNFEDEMQKIFLAKLQHQEKTLLGLKQMYSNMDSAGRNEYYSSYFNIDPTQNVNDVWNILGYYVYGLKFVYEYYFKNLASWSWYYPYYFAPLLTDLQFYLQHLITNGQLLDKFDRGAPFEPFKQLLCILPKQSADLLPPNFQKYLLDQQSILRNPVDFYPDNVESVTYGSIRAHEAISLIPFLDQNLVCKAYESEISTTAESDLPRNIRRDSRLYEYSDAAEQQTISSPFSTIDDFTCKISIKEVSLLSRFNWKTINASVPVNEGDEKLLKMPTLYMRQFQFTPLKQNRRDGGAEMRFFVQLTEPSKQAYKLGETIFYGYPIEHSGRIEGILTKRGFNVTSSSVDIEKYQSIIQNNHFSTVQTIKESASEFFQYIKGNIQRHMYGKEQYYEFVDLSETEAFLFIVDTKSFSRTIDGQFVRLFKDNFKESHSIVPACITSKTKIYQTTKTNIKFPSIQKEFALNQEVLLVHPDLKLCGAKGKVVGYTNDHRKVKVQIIQQPKYNQSKFTEVLKILTTKTDIFFSLRFAAEIVGLKFDHLQSILGSINVVTPKDSKLPPSIDIGLNFMSRKEHKIVPNLVRINFFYEFDSKKSNPFKYLELSVRALEIILQYKKKFPQIFTFMEERHYRLIEKARDNNDKKIDWDEAIRAENIYKDGGAAKCLMKVYKWLVQKEQTHMPVSSIYSKQVQQKRIEKLQQLFQQSRSAKEQSLAQSKKKRKYVEAKIEVIDPNFLFSQKLSNLGTLYLRKRPKNHQIGDLVICVSPQFFGHYGAIIGIDDNKYEVLFDEPSFGKNELGGLCSNLWGAKLAFKQILNLTTWPELFYDRVRPSNHDEKMGWIENTEYFYPQYKSKPFQDFEDVKIFITKEENRKFFTEQMLAEISRVQSNLKQSDLQAGFNVVDNRREEHRYKYAKKTLYIQKSQVQEAAQLMKLMDKALVLEPISTIVSKPIEENLIEKEVKAEIIENKVQDTSGNGEIGEEEDAEDILG